MTCRVCNSKSNKIHEAKIMRKYDISYYQCGACGFLQTDDPYWMEESYQQPINVSDTGILARNMDLARKSSTILFFLFERNARFLDFAGGYGIFTRLMRDIGFDFYWLDPHAENLFAKGFVYDPSVGAIELITSFESYEHFVFPMEETKKMLAISKNILFSTELVTRPAPKPSMWWYYGLDHGQHISFYSMDTLKHMARSLDLKLFTNGANFHLLTPKKMNNFFFNFLLKLCRSGLPAFVRIAMKSKTKHDHDLFKT